MQPIRELAGLLFILFMLTACQSTGDADRAIWSHPWANALRMRGEAGVAEVSTTVAAGSDTTCFDASLPYFRLLAPTPPDFTIVCLHGDPGGKEVWAPLVVGDRITGNWPPYSKTTVWHSPSFSGPTWKGLAEDYDVIVLDLPGHGQATGSPRVVDPGIAGRLVYEAISQIRSKREIRGNLVLMGHSFGGEVAWRMALQKDADNPIDRLVLVDSVGMVRKPHEIQESEKDFEDWFWGGAIGGIVATPESEAKKGLAELYKDKCLITVNRVAALYRAYTNRGDNYWVSRAVTFRETGRKNDLETFEALRKIQTRTLLVWGADDPAWTLQTQGVAFRSFMPNASLAVIERCGHLPTEERPDVLVGVVRSWLTDCPPDKLIAQQLSSAPPCDEWFLQHQSH